MNTLAAIVGSGLAGTLIAYPLMYYALSNHVKTTLSNLANLGLFVLAVPLVGAIQVTFGGHPDSVTGFLVLFGAPLLVTFVVIGPALEIRSKREKAKSEVAHGGDRVGYHLPRFTSPVERVSFVLLILGISFLIVGLVGYWIDRGFYLSELKYDISEIFLDDISYRRGWAQWCARGGLVVSVFSYITAYHYERIVAPMVRCASGLVRWVRTGE